MDQRRLLLLSTCYSALARSTCTITAGDQRGPPRIAPGRQRPDRAQDERVGHRVRPRQVPAAAADGADAAQHAHSVRVAVHWLRLPTARQPGCSAAQPTRGERGEARPLGAQPLPLVPVPAASQVAPSAAFDPPGRALSSSTGASRWRPSPPPLASPSRR